MPCCGCCGNGFIFGHLMYILEKIAAFCAMTAIISCIIVTVLISIGIGVGLGYNYCFVDTKTNRFAAVENLKNSDDPAILPQSPNAFPFSGVSSNETEVSKQNQNVMIDHPPTIPPTFPSIPNIPITTLPPWLTTEYYYEVPPRRTWDRNRQGYYRPRVAGSDASGIPTGSGFGSNLPSSPSDYGNASDISNPPSTQAPIPSSPGNSGSEQRIFSNSGEQVTISNIPNPTISPGDIPVIDLSVDRDFPNIPQSPNFPGSYRRIPTSHSKDRPAASVLTPDVRPNLQRLKESPVTARALSEFDAIQDDIGSGGTKIADTDYTEEPDYRQTVYKENYRRRKPAQRKNIKKVTKTTPFMPTIVIPLKKYANMSPLISKILAQNKNVTLQFITL